jgi:hypothetical protein
MKIIKFLALFVLTLGIIVLMVWAVLRAKEQKCTDISIAIQPAKETQLLSKSDILNILVQNNAEWEGKKIKEIDLASINKILASENYIKSVDKLHISGSKLQVEITLYDILMDVETRAGQKFLLDINGIYLPHSPKTDNDVIIATGFIPHTFHNKETVTPDAVELYELIAVALLIKADPFYEVLFKKLHINEKQEIVMYPSIGNIPILFGNIQDAENKLKSLKYLYEEVIPYLIEDRYALLDVRFKNRIVATKTKT